MSRVSLSPSVAGPVIDSPDGISIEASADLTVNGNIVPSGLSRRLLIPPFTTTETERWSVQASGGPRTQLIVMPPAGSASNVSDLVLYGGDMSVPPAPYLIVSVDPTSAGTLGMPHVLFAGQPSLPLLFRSGVSDRLVIPEGPASVQLIGDVHVTGTFKLGASGATYFGSDNTQIYTATKLYSSSQVQAESLLCNTAYAGVLLSIATATTFNYALELANAAGVPGSAIATIWNIYSAAAGKENVRSYDDALSVVANPALNAHRYTIPGYAPPATVRPDDPTPVAHPDPTDPAESIGFLADEWVGVVPELVSLNRQGQPAGLDYDRIGAITFQALKQYITNTDAALEVLNNRLLAIEGSLPQTGG